MKFEKPICNTCGSDNVMADAWAEWDVSKQRWEISNTFDEMFCQDCDGPTKCTWVEEGKDERG